MTKEDLNRLFGDPEIQKPVTPLDLLSAALLIKEGCNNIPLGKCKDCIFYIEGTCGVYGCSLFDVAPRIWNLSDAKRRTTDWINEQRPQDSTAYLDTDKYTEEVKMSYKDLYKLSADVGSVRDVIEMVCLDEEHGLKKDVDPGDIWEIMNSLALIREKLFDAAYDLENGIT